MAPMSGKKQNSREPKNYKKIASGRALVRRIRRIERKDAGKESPVHKKRFARLNEETLEQIIRTLEGCASSDMSEIARSYFKEAEAILGSWNGQDNKNGQERSARRLRHDSDDYELEIEPIPFQTDPIEVACSRQGRAPPFIPPDGAPQTRFEALRELYCPPVPERRDSLSAFLEANMPPEPDEQAFNYIRLEDVIKSKGNAVRGPRREDVGRFNMKLFESHVSRSPELNIVVQPNVAFYEPLRGILSNSQAKQCAEALIFSYNSSGCFAHGRCVVVVHSDANGEPLFTAADTDRVFFQCLRRSNVVSSLRKPSNIACISLDDFVVFNIMFNDMPRAEQIFYEFFRNPLYSH